MIRKSFLQRVKDRVIGEGWQIKYTDIPFIDFFSVRPHTKTQKAYHIKPHGHLLKAEVKALQEYGRAHKIHVLYVHATSGWEPEFVRLYPQNAKSK